MDDGALSSIVPDESGPLYNGDAARFGAGPYAGAVDSGVPPEALMRRPSGALSQSPGPGPATQWMTDLSRGLVGDSPQGALSRLDSLQQGMDSAAAEKARRIQSAMSILQAARMDQSTNLPMAAFGAGLMAPTRSGSFGEALGAGTNAMIPVVQQQRQRDMDYALQQGKLGVAASDVDVQHAQQAATDFYKRLQLSEEAAKPAVTAETWGQRSDAAYQRATDVAGIRTQAQRDVAGIKDDTTRLSILTRTYMQKLNLDEKTAHDMASEDLGAARVAVGQQNADANTQRVGTGQGTQNLVGVRQRINKLLGDSEWKSADPKRQQELLTLYGITADQARGAGLPVPKAKALPPAGSSLVPIAPNPENATKPGVMPGNPLD